ncbi:MAG: hypothetical protein U0V87_05150 [Acidobacteriota bacterium]
MDRRTFVLNCATTLGLTSLLSVGNAEAGPVRRHRRRVRRRIRRRHRRRVAIRMIAGRPFWVVPVGLAIGWELLHDNHVVVVKEIKVIEREGAKVEVTVVQHSDGKLEEVEITREDNADNKVELEGSQLPDDDKKTPGVEAEVEVEED